jgi:hypothetical protein
MGRKNSECSHHSSESDEVSIEQKVEDKIKALGTLSEKVQAIAINKWLIEKRALDTKLAAEITKIEVNHRKKYEPYLQ